MVTKDRILQQFSVVIGDFPLTYHHHSCECSLRLDWVVDYITLLVVLYILKTFVLPPFYSLYILPTFCSLLLWPLLVKLHPLISAGL